MNTGNQIAPFDLDICISSKAHVFIEASAGSGKTTALEKIIVQLISNGHAEIPEILALTFSDRAASELRKRVYTKLGGYKTPSENIRNAIESFSLNGISTFHAFCSAQLRMDTLLALKWGNVKAVTDTMELLQRAMHSLIFEAWNHFTDEQLLLFLEANKFGTAAYRNGRPDFEKRLFTKAAYAYAQANIPVLPEIETARDVTTPDEFFSFCIGFLAEKMHEHGSKANLLTFDDMVFLMAQLPLDGQVNQGIRAKFKYVLIDEFQDTDLTQWSILERFFLQGDSAQKLFLVGDPKQAIYKFRGADVFVYQKARDLLKRDKNTIEQWLKFNYRSAPELVNFLDRIWGHSNASVIWNLVGVSYIKPVADVKTQGNVHIYETQGKFSAEFMGNYASFVVAQILKLRREDSRAQIAILAFANHNLKRFETLLKEFAIDYAFSRNLDAAKQEEILQLSYLLQTFESDMNAGYSDAKWTCFLQLQTPAGSFRMYSEWYVLAAEGQTAQVIRKIYADSQGLAFLLEKSPDRQVYYRWHHLFQTLIEKSTAENMSLLAIREFLERVKPAGSNEAETNMIRTDTAVHLMSIHASKGLEFDHVFIADGVSRNTEQDFAFYHDLNRRAVIPVSRTWFNAWDQKLSSSGAEADLDSLNLLYVALTRAKTSLTFSCATPRGDAMIGPISRFIYPLLETLRSEGLPAVSFILHPFRTENSGTGKTGAHENEIHIPELPPDNGYPARILERHSFSSLTRPDYDEIAYQSDSLPRGKEFGVFMHSLLQNMDFKNFLENPETREILRLEIRENLEACTQAAEDRILEMIETALKVRLPGANISLSDLPDSAVRKEISFVSAGSRHAALAGKPEGLHQMRGAIDLMFEQDNIIYLVDYKTNLLSDLSTEAVARYTGYHYGEQARIYLEAMQTQIDSNPGSSKCRNDGIHAGGKIGDLVSHKIKLGGCFFLYLRYLTLNSTTGIFFQENN